VSTSAPIVTQIGLSAPRVAVVFDGGEGWHYWARLAIHAASRLWGGRGYLLVPHVDGDVASELLSAVRTYDPDYVLLLDTTVGQRELVSPGAMPLVKGGRALGGEERALTLEQIADQDVLDPVGISAREAVAAVCSPYHQRLDGKARERLRRLRLNDRLGPLTPLSGIPAVAGGPYLTAPAEWGGALGVMVAARYGLFHEPVIGEAPELTEQDRRELLPFLLARDEPTNGRPPDRLLGFLLASYQQGDDPHRSGTAFQRTTVGLGQASFGYRPDGHVTYVIGDSAADFAAAYAREVLYGDGVWLPSEVSPCGGGTDAQDVRYLLESSTVMTATFRGGRVTVCTVSASPAEVDATVQALRTPEIELGGSAAADRSEQVVEVVVGGNLSFPRDGAMSWAVEADLDHPAAIPAVTQDDGSAAMLSPVPVPDISDALLRESTGLTWQVDVRPEGVGVPSGRGLDGEHLLAAGEDPYLTWVRSGRDGIRFESHRYNSLIGPGTPRLSRLARPKLRNLSVMEWARCLASQKARSVQLSDAGRRADVLRRIVSGREQLAELFGGPMLPVLRGFLSDTVRTTDRYSEGEGVVLHAAGTNNAGYEGYLTFDGMARFDPRGDEDKLTTDVDDLVMAGLLRRGIIINCGSCGRVTFTVLDMAGQTIICPRCQAHNPLTRKRWVTPASGPNWYFDLHPVVRDLLRDNGEVPLQLALHLRRTTRSYTDASELELFDAAGKRIAELDLPAYADGQVVVAEAKCSTTLGDRPGKEATKKILLADMLQADQLLFATSAAEWTPGSLTAIAGAVRTYSWAAASPPAVRIITSLGSPDCRDLRMDTRDGRLTDW
jgi:hypothetical protein